MPLWERLAAQSQHAHAYLLHGPKGIGKQQFARHWAAWFLCHKPLGHQTCGTCSACQLGLAGHPDFYVLEPEEANKSIKIDAVRQLIQFLAQTAQLGTAKVVVLNPAEAMNLNAANALLKCLEEPTAHTKLLLVSHAPSYLLPTIRSRCIQQAAPMPSASQSIAWLQAQNSGLSLAAAEMLLELAAQAPLNAQSFHQQNIVQMRTQVVEDIKQLLKRQRSPMQLAEAWRNFSLLLLLDWFCQWVQALIRFRLTQELATLGALDMQKVLHYLADKTNTETLIALQYWLLEQRYKVVQRAPLNVHLLLEALLIRWEQLLTVG